MHLKVFFLIVLLSKYTYPQVCVTEFTDLLTGEVFDAKECSPKEPCLAKCCEKDEMFSTRPEGKSNVVICVKTDTNEENDRLMKFYGNGYKNGTAATNTTLKNFQLVHSKTYLDRNCYHHQWHPRSLKHYNLENGKLAKEALFEFSDKRWQEYEMLTFCYDIIKKNGLSPVYFVRGDISNAELTSLQVILQTIAHATSCIFLLLGIIINFLIGKYKINKDKAFMAQMISLFIMYLIQLISTLTKYCSWLGTVKYFVILSNIFWINVGSYHIWQKFRSFKSLTVSMSGRTSRKRKQFCMWCLYAVGIPLVMSSIALCIDLLSLGMKYKFRSPELHLCFYSDQALTYYVHMPLLIITISNMVFFGLTLFNIKSSTRTSKKTLKESILTHEKKSRFMFFKLSALMGFNWLLELAQSYEFPDWLVEIFDFYNRSLGFVIFIFFVCSKNTFEQLTKRWTKRGKRQSDFHISRSKRANSSIQSSQIGY